MNQIYGVLIIDETPEGRAQLRKEAMAAGFRARRNDGRLLRRSAFSGLLLPNALLASARAWA